MAVATPAGTEESRRFTFWGLVGLLIVGCTYLMLSLPRGVGSLSANIGWNWLASLAKLSTAINADLPSMPALIGWVRWGLLAYIVILLILGLRHRRLDLFGWGLFALLVATTSLHALAWIGFILFNIVGFVLYILGAVLGFLTGWIIELRAWVHDQLLHLIDWLHSALAPLVGNGWWLAAGVAVVLIVFLAFKGPAFLKILSWILLGLAGFVVAVYVLSFVLELFKTYVAPLIPYVLGAIGLVIAVATIGQLFIDQFKSAYNAGNGRLGVVIGAMAVGTALALLMLEGNIWGAYSFYPSSVAALAEAHLLQAAPSFDAAVALVMIIICAWGLLRNLSVLRPEPSLNELGRSAIYAVVGVIVFGAIMAVARQTES